MAHGMSLGAFEIVIELHVQPPNSINNTTRLVGTAARHKLQLQARIAIAHSPLYR